MVYGVIAAGEGSRLAAEGINMPKPLVKIDGEMLIDRLLRIFMACYATEIVVICNDLTPMVADHLQFVADNGLHGCKVPLRFVVKTTSSSMHSFHEISRFINADRFVVTTVDTIFREGEFRQYIECFRELKCDGLFGVTDYIDDEKPLYVATDNKLNIQGFYDECPSDCRFISGGIYGLTPEAFGTLERCVKHGEARMRNFQRALVRERFQLRAFPFSKVLDIDHASDISKAEAFLQS